MKTELDTRNLFFKLHGAIQKEIENSNYSHEFIFNISISDDWYSIHVMGLEGEAFGRLYFFDDDKESCYLDMLEVQLYDRKNRNGTKLQEIRENIGKILGFKYSKLWVKKDTWMKEWYERRGYTYHCDKEDNAIWMIKEL